MTTREQRHVTRLMGFELNKLGDKNVRTMDFDGDHTVLAYKGLRRVKDNLIAYGLIGVIEPGQPDRELHIFTADDVHRVSIVL